MKPEKKLEKIEELIAFYEKVIKSKKEWVIEHRSATPYRDEVLETKRQINIMQSMIRNFKKIR